MIDLTSLSTELLRCNRCGFCQEACPTYGATGLETAVARGRNQILRAVLDAGVGCELTSEERECLYACLLCGACAEVCPSGIPTDKLVAAGRTVLLRRRDRPLVYRVAVRRFLESPRRAAFPIRLLRLYQRSGLRWLLRRSGLVGLARSLGYLDGALPSIPPRSLRSELRGHGQVPGQPRASRRAAYFLGCMTDSLYPSVGEAVLGVLEVNGYEAVVADNVCCGAPHQSYGDLETARRLARVNLDHLRSLGADVIVSDCATCLSALKGYPDLFREEPEYLAAAEAVAATVRETGQFLLQNGFARPEGRLSGVVTYHDPCHLARKLGVVSEPRQILRAIPGLAFRELDEAGRCCGGAGSYGVGHSEVSTQILDRKMNNVARTSADFLATSCPSCLMQLGLGLRRAALPTKLAHPVQLLWRSYVLGGQAPQNSRACGSERRNSDVYPRKR